MSRSCGIKRDLRLSNKDVYSNYNLISFKSYIGVNGDCYDRYLIRMLEMGESLHIINVVANKLLVADNKVNLLNTNILQQLYYKNSLKNSYTSMEDLINHFIH
jgi:NADH:ubiquinone oxidoreductase subunit D